MIALLNTNLTAIDNALSIKYNEDDDYLYVLVGGEYVKTSYKMYARDWVLYRDGVFASEFSKSYTYSYNSAYANTYNLTFYDTYFTASVGGGRHGENYAYFHATFASPIDVTDYSKLVIVSPDASCVQWHVGLHSTTASGSAVYNCTSNLADSTNWLENEDGTYTLTLDISGVKGLAYVALGSQVVGETYTGKFAKIYLN